MKKYKVIIRTPGRLLNINSKVVRTPVEFYVTEKEIKKIRPKFLIESITDYSIIEYDPEQSKIITRNISNKKHEQIKKENSITKTILETILLDD